MKIDLIGPSYPFRGGISHYTTLLYKGLKKRHETKFYSFKRQYPAFLFLGKTDRDNSDFVLKEDDVQPILDSLNPFTWIKVAVQIVSDNPDLAIIPWWVAFWTPHFLTIAIILKLFSNVHILFICHNVYEHEANIAKRFFTMILLSMGDYFIVHSSEEKKRLEGIIGRRQIVKTYPPTYDFFNTGEIPKHIAKNKIDIDDDRVILFFGFVREYKGLQYLLEAMSQILEEIDVRLLICGEFWDDKSKYIQKIKSLNIKERVTIIDGYIPNEELPYYFYASDIVVLPYVTVTGSGIVQLAYGFNKPVVVTSTGVLKEVVMDNKTGFVVPPKNSNEIAKAILKFYLSSNRDELVDNIKREKHMFSWDILINKIESFMI